MMAKNRMELGLAAVLLGSFLAAGCRGPHAFDPELMWGDDFLGETELVIEDLKAEEDARDDSAADEPNKKGKDEDELRAVPVIPRLRPGLSVRVFVMVAGEREVEEGKATVFGDGTLSLPLIGKVQVNGMTLDVMTKHLQSAYCEYYRDPQVVAQFVSGEGRDNLSPWGTVTVLGRVKNPGAVAIPATQDLTLSQSIQQVGGLNTSARSSAIRLTRTTADGETIKRTIDLNAIGAKGRVEDDIILQAGDVIYVPESFL